MRPVLAILIAMLLATPTWAANFAIDLKVSAGKATQTAHAHKSALGSRPQSRPVLEIKTGQRVHVRWELRCTAARQPLKDVLVHFFIVREKQAGQHALPKLDKTVTVESALTMDFRTGAKADGEMDVMLDQPGTYLVRLETQGAAGAGAGSESDAALDVIVHGQSVPQGK